MLAIVTLAMGCNPSPRPTVALVTPAPTGSSVTPAPTGSSAPTEPIAGYPGFGIASSTCRQCLPSGIEHGECGEAYAACSARPGCRKYLGCVDTCRNDLVCRTRCMEAKSEDTDPGDAYLFCTCCRSDCATDCATTCDGYRSSVIGPVGAGCMYPGLSHATGSCNRCLEGMGLVQSTAYRACVLESAPCSDLVDCIETCGKAVSCRDACRKNAPNALALAEPYFRTLCCGTCATECQPECAAIAACH